MTHQSHVADASIVKVDADKRLVFGWASIIKDEAGKILLDRQDDFIDSEDELEKAAYDYVLRSRDGGEMHVRRGVAKMVESVVFTEDKQRAMGIPVGSMPTGWWIGFKVNDERVWEQVKKGEYAGFSVHGTGKRESTQLPVSKITEIGKADMKKKKNKIATVMSEFKAGKLKSSSGEKVTDPKQAMAIAISEQKRAKMKKVDIADIVEKTAELSKHGRHNQQSHAGGRRGRGSAPRDKNASGGGSGTKGGKKVKANSAKRKAEDKSSADDLVPKNLRSMPDSPAKVQSLRRSAVRATKHADFLEQQIKSKAYPYYDFDDSFTKQIRNQSEIDRGMREIKESRAKALAVTREMVATAKRIGDPRAENVSI